MSKKLIPLVNKYIVWDGTFDTSWKTKDSDGVCHITTPEQFADFFLDHTQSSKSGISNVVLDNDICMNEDFENALDWTSSTNIKIIDKTTRNNFMDVSLTFDGQGHTIYGFANRVSADFASSYWANNGNTLTFKNVRFYGRYIETTKGSNCFCSLCGFDNGRYKFEGVQYHKFKVNNLVNGMSGRTKNLFSCCAQNTYCDIDVQFVDCEFANQDYIFSSDANSTSTIPSGSTLKISVNGGTSSTRLINGSKTTTIQNDVHSVVYNLNNTIPTDSSYPFVNPIVDENLESYVSTHNDFSDYEFDENGDYEDLQPLNPGNLKIYEPLVHNMTYKPIPEGSDFLWRAMDYDTSTKNIPNMVKGSSFDTYNANGTPTKNGSGKDCYISGDYNNYLRYDNLSSTQMTNFYANSNSDSYYTYIFKVYNTSGVGGIVSFRSNANVYNYMIRSNGNNFQVHDTTGHDVCSLIDGHICKVEINYDKAYWYDLTDGRSGFITIGTTRNMGTTMFSIQSEIGATREASLSKWYGIYGIPRQLTDEETQNVYDIFEDIKIPLDPNPLHYQKRTEVEDPTPKYWDGTFDTSWKTKDSDGVCHITTPEQFADFLRNTDDSSKSGISNVVLDNDIYMNEDFENALNWSSTSNERKLTKSSRGNFTQNSLTFNGNGYTIYGLSISLGTANWNTIFYINQNGITFSFNNTRFYGFYLQTNNSMGTFNPLAYSDTSPTIEFKEISFVKLNLKHLSSSVQAGRPKAFTGVQDDKFNIKTYFDFSFDECDFSGCEYIIARDWLSTNYYTPTKNNTTKVSIKNSKMPTKRVLDEGMYLLNVGANAYNNKTQEGTPESGHTNTNTIMNGTLESYVSTHNDFSDYDFDTNGDYEDLQPLEPYNPSKYEKVEITKIPEGSDFLWLASNYNTSNKSIKNDINESTMFDTLYDKGSLTKNGFGENCYLSGTSNSNYLYRNLDTNELNICKSNSSGQCFTYIIKASSDPNQIGGLLSFRNNGNMNVYCIRTYGGKIFYTYTNYNTTDSSIDFIDENIYMFVIKPTTTIIRNLTNGFSKTITTSTSRSLTSNFRIMNAGYNGENGITKFFGCYGASKELNEQEVESVKRILDTQKIYKWYKLGDQKLLLINPKTLEGV